MVSFLLNDIKPCSINNGYYVGRKSLTKEAMRYRKRLLVTINQNPQIKEQMKAFRSEFDPNKHAIWIEYYFLIPPKKMYLKGTGPISMLGGDVDNYMKLTTDFLFNDKYMNHAFPKSTYLAPIENLAVDDRFITDVRAYKLPNTSEIYSVGVKVNLIEKECKELPPFEETECYK